MSCFGKCSLTVALPIISALGVEAVALPTGILSTHTGGFGAYRRFDMTSEMQGIIAHWEELGLEFDGIYTGYFADINQVKIAGDFISRFRREATKVIVDPVMADNGELYSGFGADHVVALRELIAGADIITPNITEAFLLADMPYAEIQTQQMIDEVLRRLKELGARRIALTGVSTSPEKIGYVFCEEGNVCYREYEKLAGVFYGCGDVFASTLCGLLMTGKDYYEAFCVAGDFARKAIAKTLEDADTRLYGLNFEDCLKELKA